MPNSAAHLHLTPRDLGLLQLVYAYHGCGVQHLHDRFWADDSSYSATYRRLSRLVAARYLTVHRLPSLTGQGSGKTLLMLGPEGRRVIAEHLDIPLAHLPRQKLVASALFLQHHFAICDFRVALELATDDGSSLSLEGWTTELELRRRPMRITDPQVKPGEAARSITLVPDGAFILSFDGARQYGYLEQDMGTEAPKRLLVKLRGYLLQQRSEAVPLFFVTTSERRRDLVRQLAASQAAELHADATMIFVTTQTAVSKMTVLQAPIWYQAGTDRPVAIVPLAPALESNVTTEQTPARPVVVEHALVAGRR